MYVLCLFVCYSHGRCFFMSCLDVLLFSHNYVRNVGQPTETGTKFAYNIKVDLG